MKEYLLGIDLGTSHVPRRCCSAVMVRPWPPTRYGIPLYQPQNGWAEQEPSDWWRAVRETVQAVLHKSGVAAADVPV